MKVFMALIFPHQPPQDIADIISTPHANPAKKQSRQPIENKGFSEP